MTAAAPRPRSGVISASPARSSACSWPAQVVGWLVYRSVHDEPTALELTEKCLRREKLLEVRAAGSDPIAGTAGRGALATRVGDNGVVVAIAASDDEAAELADAYLATGRRIELRLDRRDRVVYVWELPRGSSWSSARRCTTAGTSEGERLRRGRPRPGRYPPTSR